MKIKAILLSTVAFLAAGAAMGQESDDMYFNSKDRAKVRASKAPELPVTLARNEDKKATDAEIEINPTDSYSARNVNPEFTSRSTSQAAASDDENYFVNNYQYRPQSQFNSWNNNFNNWYNSPWYSSAAWGSGFNSWNSWNNPYYGNYYGNYSDPWGSPFGNPYYYRSGWSSSLSYFWGSGWGSSYGMNYGWGNGFGMNSGCPFNAWGNPYAYNSFGGGWYGNPGRMIVIDNREKGYVYGKRSSRSSSLAYDNNANRTNNRPYNNVGSGSRSDRGARINTTTTSRQADYYSRTWRNDSRQQGAGSSNSNGRSSTLDNSNSRSTWRETSPAIDRTPSRSSGWDGGSRSTGGGSNNSNSGSRSSRGRGN